MLSPSPSLRFARAVAAGLRLCGAAVLVLAAGGAGAEVYKWTDAGGHVHYGERPPTGQAADPLPLEAIAPPSAAAEAELQNRTRILLHDADLREARENRERRAAQAANAREAARRERVCSTARGRLDSIEREESELRKHGYTVRDLHRFDERRQLAREQIRTQCD